MVPRTRHSTCESARWAIQAARKYFTSREDRQRAPFKSARCVLGEVVPNDPSPATRGMEMRRMDDGDRPQARFVPDGITCSCETRGHLKNVPSWIQPINATTYRQSQALDGLSRFLRRTLQCNRLAPDYIFPLRRFLIAMPSSVPAGFFIESHLMILASNTMGLSHMPLMATSNAVLLSGSAASTLPISLN